MKKFRKARCPHCGDQLKIIQIWSIKTQGEYQCPKCGGFSNIELDFTLFHISISAIIISGLLYAGCIFFKIPLSIPLILIIMLPYFIFYILSVFLVRLEKNRRNTAEEKTLTIVRRICTILRGKTTILPTPQLTEVFQESKDSYLIITIKKNNIYYLYNNWRVKLGV